MVKYVFSLHEHELKQDVSTEQYEQEVAKALARMNVSGLIKAHHLKGFKGSRSGSYAVLWVWESADAILHNFGTLDNPKWPEDWLFYENQVLAKYLTCHPDKIHFTDYDIVSELNF